MPDDLFSWADAIPGPPGQQRESWADGAALRDAGMALATEAQEQEQPGWGERAYQAIVRVASMQSTVHIDDVRRVFHEEAPNHPRAWGAVWVRAVKDRVLEPTGTVRNTTDPRKHRHPCPIYRSLLSGLAR